jgi:thioredoxin
MSANLPALTAENFDEAISKSIVFVDFWAQWCGPCRSFAPIYAQVAAQHPDAVFAKVNTEEQEELGQRFSIESIPTLMAFHHGVEVFRKSGAVPASTLEAIVAQVKNINIDDFVKSKKATEASLRGEKPVGVPPEAQWDAGDKEWVLGAKNKKGENHGPYKFWRGDGTLCNECTFVNGKTQGIFKRFHENGDVSQDGFFENGELHGTRRWLATESSTTERMHENGVSIKVRRTEMDYEHGRVVAIRHFNAAGVKCMPTNGEAYPDRPSTVTAGAEFVETQNQWQEVKIDKDRKRHGLAQFWSATGDFVFSAEYVHGARTGAHRETVAGEFLDESVVTLVGNSDDDDAVGVWTGLNAAGKTVFTRDLGIKIEGDFDSEIFQNKSCAPDFWNTKLAAALEKKNHAQAVLCAARATAASFSVAPLTKVLETVALPRNEDSAQGTAEGVIEQVPENMAALANTMLRGGDAGTLLRQFAILMDQQNRPLAALDFINAAILLFPQRAAYLAFTRSLILMSLGLEKQARIDAAMMKQSNDETAVGQSDFVTNYLDALFPVFDFWPLKEEPTSTYDELPERPLQTLAAIQSTIRKLATRIALCRDAMLRRFTAGTSFSWIPPDVKSLLPDAPVELLTFTLDAPDDESDVIEVDETLDVAHLELPDLLRMARADWNALTWLLWAAGMKDVSMPKKLSPPKNFGQAAGMASQRLWRARDRRATNRTKEEHGIEGFLFVGVDVDALSPSIVSIAEQQYAEMQALFHWLADKKNKSHWQDNLRGS